MASSALRLRYDALVVGAGFAGVVSAERLAASGRTVLLIDKRGHIGGNAYDRIDDYGVLIHPYGPHIFHTNSKKIFEYLSGFTRWRFYEHRVRAEVDGAFYPIPINRTTLNTLYDLALSEDEAAAHLARVRVPREKLQTSEDVVLSSVGHDLCEKFFRGYTRKQWGLDLSQLSAGVAARIPTRTNDDDRYFTDTFQFMPSDGYSNMFRAMLESPRIEIALGTAFESLRGRISSDLIVYTGPIDSYFDYTFGRLPYRSLRFEHEHVECVGDGALLQPVGTLNYPNTNAFTRVTEFRHLTGQAHRGSSIVREYPEADGDPYYPVPRPENEVLFKRYDSLARREPRVIFVGRLAQYRYYNMDQVVGAALASLSELDG